MQSAEPGASGLGANQPQDLIVPTLTASNPGATGIAPLAADSFPRLVADIGGTNARFGWVAAPGAAVSQVHKLPVPGFAGPAEATQAYLAWLATAPDGDARAPRHAAFAVATKGHIRQSASLPA